MARHLLLRASAFALASAAPAQIIPVPLDNSSIAPPQPTPTPEPTPSPTPTPSPEPTATAAPVSAATPARAPVRTAPTPAPVVPTVVPSPIPTPTASPVPVPTATAAPETVETVVLPQERRSTPLWPWLLGAALLAGLAWVLLRRRGEPIEEQELAYEPEPEALPVDPAPAVAAPAFFTRGEPAAGRARLTIDVRPTRAGLNLLTATVEAEITVTNTGDAPATGVRAAVALLSAGGAHDEALTQLNASPVHRPVTPAFALEPGAQHRFRAVAALPHAQIKPLTAGNRPIFVPLVAVTLRHTDGTGEHRTSQAWGVGIERVDSAKLAPFWLDVPPRSYDAVAARAQGPVQET